MADAPAVDEVAAAKEAAKRAAHENRALRKWIGDQLVEPHKQHLLVRRGARLSEVYGPCSLGAPPAWESCALS